MVAPPLQWGRDRDELRSFSFTERVMLGLHLAKVSAFRTLLLRWRTIYCNSLMYGISKANMKKLQRVQNALIRVICSLGPRESVSEARRDLHWLPIEQRIIFKIAVLTFNRRRRSAPPYLCDLVHDYLPRRTLRSGDGVTLEVPRTKTVTAERAFSVAAPTIWMRQSKHSVDLKLNLKLIFSLRVNHSHLAFWIFLNF